MRRTPSVTLPIAFAILQRDRRTSTTQLRQFLLDQRVSPPVRRIRLVLRLVGLPSMIINVRMRLHARQKEPG